MQVEQLIPLRMASRCGVIEVSLRRRKGSIGHSGGLLYVKRFVMNTNDLDS